MLQKTRQFFVWFVVAVSVVWIVWLLTDYPQLNPLIN